MIHDKLVNWRQYFSSTSFTSAFEYLESLSPDSNVCEMVPLGCNGLYASIMSYPTCCVAGSVLETHDKHIDIQMSLVGSEAIDWFDRDQLEIKTPYDDSLDRTFYHRPAGPFVRINNLPGYFTVLFPGDAHMPMLQVEGEPNTVKKVVVKVPIKVLE